MHGIVLAAGFGRRLEQVTRHIPKPMIKVNDIAMIDHAIHNLIKLGATRILINTHYKFLTLQDFVSQQISQKRYGNVIIHFLHETEILETGGAILSAMRQFNLEEIVVVNSDIIMPQADLSPLLSQWTDKAEVLGLLYDKNRISKPPAGDFDLTADQSLIQKAGGQYVWMGVYRIRRTAFLEYLHKPDMRFPIMDIIFKNSENRFFGIPYEGVWIDMAGALERAYKLKQDKWGQLSPEEINAGLTVGAKLNISLEQFYELSDSNS